MENLSSSGLLLLLDVAPEPVRMVSWGLLLLFLGFVFFLAVFFTVSLVGLLIWLKRRKISST